MTFGDFLITNNERDTNTIYERSTTIVFVSMELGKQAS